jgi:WD40 repeat protein
LDAQVPQLRASAQAQAAADDGGGEHAALLTLSKQAPQMHRFSVSAVAWYPVDSGLFVSGESWQLNLGVPGFGAPGFMHQCEVNGWLLSAGGYDGEVKVWDANTLQVLHERWLPAVALLPWLSSTMDAASGHSCKWSCCLALFLPLLPRLFLAGQVVCGFAIGTRVQAAVMSTIATSHCLVAVGSADTTVQLCDIVSGGFTHSLSGHRAAVWALAWSPASEWQLVTGDEQALALVGPLLGAFGELTVWPSSEICTGRLAIPSLGGAHPVPG